MSLGKSIWRTCYHQKISKSKIGKFGQKLLQSRFCQTYVWLSFDFFLVYQYIFGASKSFMFYILFLYIWHFMLLSLSVLFHYIIMIIIAIILIILVTIKVWLGTFSKVYSDSMRATWRWCKETSVFPLAMPTHVLA